MNWQSANIHTALREIAPSRRDLYQEVVVDLSLDAVRFVGSEMRRLGASRADAAHVAALVYEKVPYNSMRDELLRAYDAAEK